jgi:UDP-N-acetylmuramate dehydrogenase
VKDTLVDVRALDRRARRVVTMDAAACGFSYRGSVFKGDARYVVLAVTFSLVRRPDSAPLRYAELTRALGVAEGARAPLADVRSTVVSLRRAKGMVLDPSDPDSVSAGSFFVNPVLDLGGVEALERALVGCGVDAAKLPRFPEHDRRVKVSAAWLIERAGFGKGWGEGNVGISRKHALALVNRGGATARELLAAAGEIQRGVRERFGVELAMEPVVVGRE